MPLYEYLCKSCDRRFEILQRMGATSEGVRCPQCGAERTEKQFSTFSGTSSSPGAGFSALGGGCGSGGFT